MHRKGCNYDLKLSSLDSLLFCPIGYCRILLSSKISEYDIIKRSWLVPETKSLNSTSGTIKGNTQFSNACISEQKGNKSV
jgi:hypothetical protein